MRKFIKFEQGSEWWFGKITFNYNLGCFLLPFVLIAMIFVYLYEKIAQICKWIGAQCKAFWEFLVRTFGGRQPANPSQKKGNAPGKWWWLGVLLLSALLIFLLCKTCSSVKENNPANIEDVYNEAFDEVVIARAYLDGVQGQFNISEECPRALVGFKFVDGRPVSEYDFSDKTYDEAVRIVADEWRPCVTRNLFVNLSQQQMTVVILVAMRMGPTGFARSTFLAKVNAGDFEGAADWLVLQDKDGRVRKTGDEPKQYFSVLKLMWNGEISANDLLDYPIFSYKKLPVDEYNPAAMIKIMQKGNNQTPRRALGLD